MRNKLVIKVLLMLAYYGNQEISATCITSDGKTPNQPCIFPFIYRGVIYNGCTFDISYVTGNKPWCSTKVDENGVHVNGNWGSCESPSCPIPPRKCGITARNQASLERDGTIESVPWVVSIGVEDEGGFWSHKCGGALITNSHVVSAAHCFLSIELGKWAMRLGNHDLNKDARTEHEVFRYIHSFKMHPKYKVGQSYFDIALAYTPKRIEFTDFIRPICLPSKPVDNVDQLADNFVTLAGWGLNNQRQVTNRLSIESIRVNPQSYCSRVFSEENLKAKRIPPIKLRQQLPHGFQPDTACAGTEISPLGACEGDSGSALFRLITDTTNKPYYELAFIVSSGVSCKLEATLYMRIAERRILTWIQKETKTGAMLMVVGGYVSGSGNNLTSDVELVSTIPGNFCSKRVRPLPGRYFNLTTHIEKESSTLGMIGDVTKDTVVVCGGRTGAGVQDKCYIYDPVSNTWEIGLPMLEKRHLASSVLDDKGNLWVLGGVSSKSNAANTEIFDIRSSKWTRGKPLPPDYRDGGVSSHCTVRLNSSHVMLMGGYVDGYEFRAPNIPNFRPIFIPGIALAKAWLFNGNYWQNLPDMSTVRDRPACSLVQLPNGDIRILVAGGCNGWCAKNPPLASAEMFDPESMTWTTVSNLPKPLHSSKMEILDGLPTMVGGTDGLLENRALYQFNPVSSEWETHPTAKLRLPRSSPAVFQVPHAMFDDC